MKLELRDRVQIVIFAHETGVNRPAAPLMSTRRMCKIRWSSVKHQPEPIRKASPEVAQPS
jgi:hypothetical protein